MDATELTAEEKGAIALLFLEEMIKKHGCLKLPKKSHEILTCAQKIRYYDPVKVAIFIEKVILPWMRRKAEEDFSKIEQAAKDLIRIES